LDAVFQLAVPSPMIAIPVATATGLASTEVPNPARTSPKPTMMLPIRMVRLEPSRRTISPDADTETKEPAVRQSRSRPMVPGVRSRPSRIAGSRDTQVENAIPLAP